MGAGISAQETIGGILRQARRQAGLTQEELAEQTGLSLRAIGDLERGQTERPRRRSIQLLARALGLPESVHGQLMGLVRQQMAAGADEAAEVAEVARAGRWLAPAQLPADIADFTGRAGPVGTLRQILAAGVAAPHLGALTVAVVTGAAGTGKTTLAVHTAHLMRAQFPEGQLFAELRGMGSHSAGPAEILARFLRDLGVAPDRIPDSAEELAAQYRSQLTGRRVLIVLDDARDAAQVQPLLPGSASCVVLVTSRRWLSDLAGSHLVELDVFARAEAQQLFAVMIGPDRAAAERAALDEVLRACAGLPLAIRIAGARLAARSGWTVRTMADRLTSERRRLDQLTTGSLAVRASFEVGVSALPAPDQADRVHPAHAFRMLGLWPGPAISLDAAAVLLGEDRESIADALEALVDAQLLQSPAPDRYQFHDLLRVHAGDRVIAEVSHEVRHEAIGRVLTWYLCNAEATAELVSPHRYKIPMPSADPDCTPLAFSTAAEAMNWCETERANMVAGVRLAAAYGWHELAWRLAVGCSIFFNRRRYLADWMASLQVAESSARLLNDQRAEALVLNNMGTALARQGMHAEAVSYFERALAIRREIGDMPGQIQAATTMADCYVHLNRPEEAISLLHQAADINRLVASPYVEGIVQNNLGEAYLMLERYSDAVVCLRQASETFDRIEDARGVGYALYNLGHAYLGLGREAEAILPLERAVEVRQACGDPFEEARSWQALGEAQLVAGDRDQARHCLHQAATAFRALGEEAMAAGTEAQLAELG
jgi:tetratricopeptide (TPR) repeat protein/transcriptional regulator with XRE-family HTH domain